MNSLYRNNLSSTQINLNDSAPSKAQQPVRDNVSSTLLHVQYFISPNIVINLWNIESDAIKNNKFSISPRGLTQLLVCADLSAWINCSGKKTSRAIFYTFNILSHLILGLTYGTSKAMQQKTTNLALVRED